MLGSSLQKDHSEGKHLNPVPCQTHEEQEGKNCKITLALLGTIQFVSLLRLAEERFRTVAPGVTLLVPQVRPLSPGETLGCTAPLIDPAAGCFVFVADGRFHLEAGEIRS
jgi:2-(3-amino-3-carboxypropyl)histidine synthase